MSLITTYWSMDSVIILAGLITAAYFYMTRKFNYWRNRGIVEIPPTPFVGNFGKSLLLKKAPQNLMKGFYKRANGAPYIGFYILDKPALLICDHKLLHKILIKDFDYFCDRYTSTNPNDRISYANLISLKNPTWKFLRTKLTPFFTPNKMRHMFDLMQRCAKDLEKYLDILELQGNGKMIDVKALSSKCTGSVIINTAFGLDTDRFKNPDDEFITNANLMFHFTFMRALEIFAIFFVPSLVNVLYAPLFGRQSSVFMHKKFWEIFPNRMKSGRMRNDFIDYLIELKKKHGNEEVDGFKFDGDDLISQVASFVSGGFDVSALPMAFALYELAMHPEIQTRLRNNILEVLESSSGDITFNMVSSHIPYLDMVLSETLRLYPPVGFLNRQTMNDYKIPDTDIVIEKGTPIYISNLGFHYDPQFFPDPDTFDPERFSDKNKCNIPSCVYLPFGQGPHMCIAPRFSYLQIKLMLITILSKYELTPCEKTPKPMVWNSKTILTAPLHDVIYLNIRRIGID